MNKGFIYTRWLLTLTFICLMGLLAVGMMAVHSKRTLRTLAANLDRKETQLQELGRRHYIMDTYLASSLSPGYLKQLVAMSGLLLSPPREDRIIVVHSNTKQPEKSLEVAVTKSASRYRTRFELVNNEPGERE